MFEQQKNEEEEEKEGERQKKEYKSNTRLQIIETIETYHTVDYTYHIYYDQCSSIIFVRKSKQLLVYAT